MSSIRSLCLVLVGVATHLCCFHRFEHHMFGGRYFQLIFLFVTAHVTNSTLNYSKSLQTALGNVLVLIALFLNGLYLSLIFDHFFLSPLRRFPGPIGAKISNLWLSLHLRNCDAHKRLFALHETYGDFLRIGSSDLSIVHPKAVQVIYAPQSKCTKADWYDLTLPMVSIQTTRNRALHGQRRRIWSRAFAEKSLRGYEQSISVFQDQLMRKVQAAAQQPINVTELLSLYSFDVMGDLAFGESFDMLRNGEMHWAVKLVDEAMAPMGLMLPTRLLTTISFATRGWWRFIVYCCQKLDEVIDDKKITSTILTTLLEPYNGFTPSARQNPDYIPRLRKELAPHISVNNDIQHHPLQYLEHLNAVISETLRLHPPVSTALQRATPPEGLHIEDTYIPGYTTVWCPQYVIGRSEAVYDNARGFIPECWSTSPSLVKEKGAYAPFSAVTILPLTFPNYVLTTVGSYSCIGKPLVLLNIRSTTAKLIMKFDLGFAEGEDGTGFEKNTKTQFTAAPGDMYLKFTER
ncbi:putative cytochrome P450 [Dothidotthia symphoricarpi CBS 119687]|uniref:Putative cytochrome P450 n=1 Tax=Dothidotthia symphoricarpi CBS 119687 TaxID=1392245 RepID=A0A6A6A8A7_9PLEO|nr:putative cytochrome P450 [Dothidotthia symphoricarpi CBS 119687]KAF2128089.1 putative cytochrome P450 [Dothidotthia symphoricarpi CBS 119687]